jgi:hypothetical protein
VEHLKGSSLELAPALPTNIRLGWGMLARDRHSTFLRAFINYGRKSFYVIRLSSSLRVGLNKLDCLSSAKFL